MDLSAEVGQYGYRRFLGTGGFTSGGNGLRADLNLTTADGFKEDAPYERQSGTIRHDLLTAGGLSTHTVLTATRVDQRDVFPLDGAAFESQPELNRSPIAFRDVDAFRWSTAVDFQRGKSLVSVTPFARHNVLKLIPNWQLTFNPEIWDTRNNSYGALVKYRHDFDPLRARVIVGADIDVSPGEAKNDGIVTQRTGPDSAWQTYTVGAAHYDYDVTYKQFSPYVHAEFSPIARARIDAGLRFDHSSYDYETHLPVVQTGRWRVPGDTTLSFSHASPKFGITIDAMPQLNLYGSVRGGFRAPAQGQLFQQGSNLNTTSLDPVTASSAEVGARGRLGRRVMYTVAWYDMRLKNDILSILDANGVSTSSNAGETRHHGIETALGAALTNDLRLDLAWSSSTQRYVDWVIPVRGRIAATPAIRSSRHRARWAMRWSRGRRRGCAGAARRRMVAHGQLLHGSREHPPVCGIRPVDLPRQPGDPWRRRGLRAPDECHEHEVRRAGVVQRIQQGAVHAGQSTDAVRRVPLDRLAGRCELMRAVIPVIAVVLCGCTASPSVRLDDAHVISNVTAAGAAPMIALSPNGARSVAWIAAPNAGTDGRLYVSTDGARATELRDTLGGIEPHGESPPKLSYGPDGTLYALYAVARLEAGRRFPFTTLRMASSTDGGRTWKRRGR
jgi:hypothetical protein